MARIRSTAKRTLTTTTHDNRPISIIYTYQIANPKIVLERSFQIYDTTPGSDDPIHTEQLVCELDELLKNRHKDSPEYRQRLEVIGFPLPLSTTTTQDEKVSRCIAHFRAEAASRKKLPSHHPNHGFPIRQFSPPYYDDVPYYRRGVIILDSPVDRWDETGVLFVRFDPVRPKPNTNHCHERDDDDDIILLPEVSIQRVGGAQHRDRDPPLAFVGGLHGLNNKRRDGTVSRMCDVMHGWIRQWGAEPELVPMDDEEEGNK